MMRPLQTADVFSVFVVTKLPDEEEWMSFTRRSMEVTSLVFNRTWQIVEPNQGQTKASEHNKHQQK